MSTWGQTSAECGGDRHLVGVVQMAQPLIHESGAVMMSHSSLHLTLLGSWLSLALKGLCCSTFHHLLESPTPFCSSSSTFSWHVECSVFVGVCAAVSPELLELSLWCGRRRSEEKRRKEQGQQVYSFFVFKCHMSVGRRGLHLDMPSFLLTFFFCWMSMGSPEQVSHGNMWIHLSVQTGDIKYSRDQKERSWYDVMSSWCQWWIWWEFVWGRLTRAASQLTKNSISIMCWKCVM